MEGQQQISSSLKEVLVMEIQFHLIYLYLLSKSYFYLSCKMKILLALIFLKKKTFLYAAYADDTTFFLKDEKSVIELMKTFDIFLTFSGLRQSKRNVK